MTGKAARESFKAGDFIFFEGDLDFHFYIVETGRVQIFTKNASGARVNITDVEEGESFGEFALLDHAPRSASAQALTEAVLIRVSQEGYEQLLSELPAWASCMLKNFAVRLRRMNKLLKTVPQFVDPNEKSGASAPQE